MDTMATTLLTRMQGAQKELDALRNVPVSAVESFQSEMSRKVQQFDDARLYFTVGVNMDGAVTMYASVFGGDDMFGYMLEHNDVSFDESYAFLTVYGEADGVDTQKYYRAPIPSDYRNVLKDIGKIQTFQEERTALICGA